MGAGNLWPKRAKWEVQNPSRRLSSWLLVQLLRDKEPRFRRPVRERIIGRQSAQLAQYAGSLMRMALRKPRPPIERGRVATSRTSSVHWSKSTWRMSDRHCHKLWSWWRANSSTAEGPTTLTLWPQHNAEAATKRIEHQPLKGCAVGGFGALPKHVANGWQRNRSGPEESPKSSHLAGEMGCRNPSTMLPEGAPREQSSPERRKHLV